MNIEKIEQAFYLLSSNIEQIQKLQNTDFYDAFVEQNAYYLGAENADELIKANNDKIRASQLTKLEWQKLFQFVLLKGAQVSPLQPNHAFTPDSIGFIFEFIFNHLNKNKKARVIEFGSGTGNLAETILLYSQKEIDYLAFEIDDLLLDLSASMSEIIGTEITFMQMDAIQPQVLEQADLVISDLPIGFYPDDQLAGQFKVASQEGHTFAHHLMIEQAVKYLKEDGFAIFLGPEDLLTSAQGSILKEYFPGHAALSAVITLPKSIFNSDPKAIYVIRKGAATHPTFAYPLDSLNDKEILQEFMQKFTKNVNL